ncbi:MAG: DUF2953 domain-containing protein [candidate division Zixibacteria bacterium]|nr:DUF2953 domain-containing protein [candidate division Zixibacteria bacterium]
MWIGLGLAGLMALMLWAPVRLVVLYDRHRMMVRLSSMGLSVQWDGSTRRRTLRLFGVRIREIEMQHDAPDPPTPAMQSTGTIAATDTAAGGRTWQRFSAMWQFRGVLRRTLRLCLRFVGRFWRAWKLESGQLMLTVGLSSPAQTGIATGVFYAMKPTLSREWPKLRVDWRPDFTRKAVEIDGNVTFRIIPLRPIWAAIRLAAALPWRGLRQFRKAYAS